MWEGNPSDRQSFTPSLQKYESIKSSVKKELDLSVWIERSGILNDFPMLSRSEREQLTAASRDASALVSIIIPALG